MPSGEAAPGIARAGAVPYSAAPSFDYVPALDGLRAASVALVVLGHAGFKHFVPGGFGVTVFFFVSGFLITRQVLAEQALRGQLPLGAFYIRRLLRLYPALLVALVIGGAIFVALGGRFPPGQVLAAVFYYTNYYGRFASYIGVPDGMYNPFGILWSLAVEEHYYLVFPALVVLLGRTRLRFALVLCAVIAAVTLWRFHVAQACSVAAIPCLGDGADDRILQGTDTRIDSILYGAVLATLLGTRWAAPLLRVLQQPVVFAVGLALLAVSFVIRDPMFRDTARFTMQGVGLFLAIGSALFSARLAWVRTLLSLPIAIRLGTVELLTVFVAFDRADVHRQRAARVHLAPGAGGWPDQPCLGHSRIPVVLAVSAGVAALSYRYVEMPMVALRRRFGSHAVRDGTPVRPANADTAIAIR